MNYLTFIETGMPSLLCLPWWANYNNNYTIKNATYNVEPILHKFWRCTFLIPCLFLYHPTNSPSISKLQHQLINKNMITLSQFLPCLSSLIHWCKKLPYNLWKNHLLLVRVHILYTEMIFVTVIVIDSFWNCFHCES